MLNGRSIEGRSIERSLAYVRALAAHYGTEHFGQLSLHLESEEQREAVARALGGAL